MAAGKTHVRTAIANDRKDPPREERMFRGWSFDWSGGWRDAIIHSRFAPARGDLTKDFSLSPDAAWERDCPTAPGSGIQSSVAL